MDPVFGSERSIVSRFDEPQIVIPPAFYYRRSVQIAFALSEGIRLGLIGSRLTGSLPYP
jgi:hypothetical protein